MMKILTILTYYYPHWTGLTAHAVKVAEGLAARGHQVTVLTSRHDASLPRDEVINGVRVVRLVPVSRISRGNFVPAFPWAAAQLIGPSDVVQIHTPLPEAAIVAALCRLLRTPMLMTHHGDLVMPEGAFNRVLEKVGYWITRVAGSLADAVTSYSRDYADHSELLGHFEDKLGFVYPPVDIPDPDPEGIQDWRKELGLEGKRVIGFAGRWVEEKGFDYLLQALPLIRRQVPEAHLAYAGETHVVYEDFYQRCLPLIEKEREHISFLGLIQDPQRMADFYGMCDLFVLPSRSDMMALVQVESMLCGTPVVATDIPGARVVVRETGFGQLAPPHDPEGLAAVIVDTLRSLETFRPTREAVRKVFNTAQSLDKYESILQRIAGKPQRNHPAKGNSAREPQAERGANGHGPVIVRHKDGRAKWESLQAEDQQILDRILANEADMAYRRRVKVLLDYLELQDGQTVLDCGCGMGFYLAAMSRLRRMNLVGLDLSLDRLRWAQAEGVDAGLINGGIYQLPFASRSFDGVLLSEVLEHLPNEIGALSEIRRVLKPGGVLAISVPHADFPFLWDPINRVWIGLGGEPIRSGPLVGIWSQHERLYRPPQLASMLQQAGFELAEVREATHYSFPLIHFLVYGIGKPLVERNLLPTPLMNSASRMRGERNTGSWINPINLGVRLFRLVDKLNETRRVEAKNTFVNVLVKARKP